MSIPAPPCVMRHAAPLLVAVLMYASRCRSYFDGSPGTRH